MAQSTPAIVSEIAANAAGGDGITIEEVTKTESDAGLEVRSVSARIRTVDDLLRHIEADMTRFEIAQSSGTTWEGLTADKATGKPIVTQLHRVFVKLRPKAGPSVAEAVEAIVEAAKRDIKKPIKPKPRYAKASGRWALLNIADPHFGKYAWRQTAGEDYDLNIAAKVVREAAAELLGAAAGCRPSRISVAFLGDVFHYDTPGGTTTKGTPLERDGRLPKMFDEGCDCLLSVVDGAGQIGPTDTVIVAGNHDAVLTVAFQKVMGLRFMNDRRVRTESTYSPRKYLTHGRNLIGFTHGHKAKKKLPQLMAIERPREWSECWYREWHTAHLHHQAAEASMPIDSIEGVVVRTAPAVCATDDYHAEEGYIGQRRAMELFIYEKDGGLSSMHVSGPKVRSS
jgi:hypothetical protein